jgi:hypothetical protein
VRPDLCMRVQDQKNFVKGCYAFVTIPILLIMPLTCGNALSTTFTGYLVWRAGPPDQQASQGPLFKIDYILSSTILNSHCA